MKRDKPIISVKYKEERKNSHFIFCMGKRLKYIYIYLKEKNISFHFGVVKKKSIKLTRASHRS